MKMHIRNKTCKLRLKSRKFNQENFSTARKCYKFQETITLQFVVERIVAKALISIEDLRQSQNQSRHKR